MAMLNNQRVHGFTVHVVICFLWICLVPPFLILVYFTWVNLQCHVVSIRVDISHNADLDDSVVLFSTYHLVI